MQLLIFRFRIPSFPFSTESGQLGMFTHFPFGWWAQMDSDHRPHAYQACALTS